MKILPLTNCVPLIPKNDIWMIWIPDKENNYKIKEFQIYDLSKNKNRPFEFSKAYRTFDYIKHRLDGIFYCDWGANCKGWEEVKLADVFFKFAIQDGLLNKDVTAQFLNQLSLVEEWRKDILMYMSFIGLNPHYEGPYDEIIEKNKDERYCIYHFERWGEKIYLENGICSECYMG